MTKLLSSYEIKEKDQMCELTFSLSLENVASCNPDAVIEAVKLITAASKCLLESLKPAKAAIEMIHYGNVSAGTIKLMVATTASEEKRVDACHSVYTWMERANRGKDYF